MSTRRNATSEQTPDGRARPRFAAVVVLAAAFLVATGAPLAATGAPLAGAAPPRPASAAAQVTHTPFACDGTLYVMQSFDGAGGNTLGKITFPSPGSPGGAQFTPLHTAGFGWNAMGFNHSDGLIYGMANRPGSAPAEVFRVGQDGEYELLGVPQDDGRPWSELGFPAGTVLPDGQFAVIPNSSLWLYILDTTTRPPTIVARRQLPADPDRPGSGVHHFSDLAVNPVDDQLYAFDETTQRIARINRGNGALTFVSTDLSAGNRFVPNGSTWIDGSGRITLLGAQDTDNEQDTFYAADFDPGSRTYGELRRLGVEPGLSNGSDGSSCAYRLTLAKTVSPSTVPAGGSVTYTYRVTNGTPGARRFTFQDVLDDGRTFAGQPAVSPPSGTPVVAGNTLTISGMTLARNATAAITAVVDVPPDSPTGTLHNQAFLLGIDGYQDVPSDYPATLDPADPTPLQVTPAQGADLSITKDGPPQARISQTFDYLIRVHNGGPTSSTGAVVTDTVPTQVAVTDAHGGQVIDGGRTVRWTLGTIPSGEFRDLILTVQATQGGDARNVAAVQATDGQPDAGGNNEDDAVTAISQLVADLSTAKSLSDGATENRVNPGATFTYHIDVTNGGPNTAPSPTLVDRVPDGLAPVLPIADNGVFNPTTREVTWALSNLPPGAVRRVLTVRADIVDTETTVENTATVHSGPGSQDDPSNNTSNPVRTTIVPVADLSITKLLADGTRANRVNPGTRFTYTIEVTNHGPHFAPESTVTDRVPDGLTPVLPVPNDGSYDPQTREVTWRLNRMVPGGTLRRTLTVSVNNTNTETTVRNTATVVADPGVDDQPGNNTSAPVVTTIVPAADLTISKSLADGTTANTVHPRDSFSYSIVMRNGGPSDAPPSTITDRVPDGLTPTLPIADGGSYDPQTRVVTWSISAVPAGVQVRRTLTVIVDDTDDEITAQNRATVTPGPGADDNPANNTSNPVDTRIRPLADLAVTKTGDGVVEAGSRFEWVVTLTNAGPSAARDVVVVDTVPAGFTVGTPSGGGTTVPAPDGTTVTWTLAQLAPGVRTFTVPVTAPDTPGSGTNRVEVRSPTDDPDAANNAAAHTVQVRGFTLRKTSAPASGPIEPGATVTYTIEARNPSPVAYDQANGLATFRDDLSDVLDDATVTDIDAGDGEARVDGQGITWTGPIPAGRSQTITVTVVVDDPTDDGDDVLANLVIGGINCRTGSTDGACSPDPMAVRELRLTKTVDATVVEPGQTITFTVTATNTGGHDFTLTDRAVVIDDLSGVLDDATFGRVRTEPAGTGVLEPPTATDPRLQWRGSLAAGRTVRLVYTVTVNGSQTGDGRLPNLVSSAEDPRCPPEDPCGPPDTPQVKAFLLDKTVNRDGPVAPGDEIAYTVTVTNSGRLDYDDASFIDDLDDVVDDATLVSAAADVGTIEFSGDRSSFVWTGPLPATARRNTPGATITVRVRVNLPNATGNHLLANVVTGSTNCPPPQRGAVVDPECTAGEPIAVRGLTVTKAGDARFARVGDRVTYTLTVRNTGQADYTEQDPATVVDNLAGVLDDAQYNGDAGANDGAPVLFDPRAGTLNWSQPLPKGATVTITYSVTVDRRDGGDHRLNNVVTAEDSNCPAQPAGPDPNCGGDGIPVAELRITKVADRDTVTAGEEVRYRITVSNIGQVEYRAAADDPAASGPASWTDDLSDVLDNATYNDDARAGAGSTSRSPSNLRWQGPVPVGGSVEITYSVRVHDDSGADAVLVNAVSAPDSDCPCSTRTGVEPKPQQPQPKGLSRALEDAGNNAEWLWAPVFALIAAPFIVFFFMRRDDDEDEQPPANPFGL